ncbi:hypothetical protein [Rathayibacter soli]|uniref:hypothetical protein n=1 Tax=Rathayibacter soli TaxID=3144168 RepID=UPI0027E3B339|nr:hypothetical protein [Glaciibacter superstes]
MPFQPHMLIPGSFQFNPSWAAAPNVSRVEVPSQRVDAVSYAVAESGPVPAAIGLERGRSCFPLPGRQVTFGGRR